MIESSNCDPARIEAFLSGELAEVGTLEVERHVEVCETCRQRLHDTAADGALWDEAGEFLSSDKLDAIPETMIVASDGADTDGGLGTDIRQVLAWLAPTDDPAMLGRIGSYEVAGVIGSGGMGVVLKGFDRALNRFVAIKVLAPHLASSGAARQRFAREAQAAAAVVHDNVVAIHGVDDANDLPYLVMPCLRGTSLQRRIDKRGALGVSEVLRIAMQTARGLAAAHDQGLVHRDIKPANILLDGTTERVLITDFGLARAADDASLTHSGVIAGTPYFMSPEQAEGTGIDYRSDLFSLGSVMYAMCTGHPPFRAETSWGILRRVSDAEIRPIQQINAEVPPWLGAIVAKLLSKRPEDRYQSAAEVAELLEQCLAHVQQPTQHALPAAALVPVPSPSILRWIVGAAIAASAVLVAFAVTRGGDAPGDTGISKSAGTDTLRSVVVPAWNETESELDAVRNAIDRLDQETQFHQSLFQEE